jgi:hypothetical protein
VFLLLRPFLAETSNETRRIAELLSQLPAEVRSALSTWHQQQLVTRASSQHGFNGSPLILLPCCWCCSLPCRWTLTPCWPRPCWLTWG